MLHTIRSCITDNDEGHSDVLITEDLETEITEDVSMVDTRCISLSEILEIRKKISDCLELKIHSAKNVKTIEKSIYNASIRSSNRKNIKLNSSEFISEYLSIGYDFYGKFELGNLKLLRSELINNQLMWESTLYSEFKNEEMLRYDRIEKPEHLNIEEGVLECSGCKCKRIHTYSQQTRSADESTTIFCTCIKCGNKWKM